MDFMAQLTLAEIILGLLAITGGPIVFFVWFVYKTWPILMDSFDRKEAKEANKSKIGWKHLPPV